MNLQSVVIGAVSGAVGRKVIRKAKWTWVGYGILAYIGLRTLRRYGVLHDHADRAIRMMEKSAKRMAMG